ncbi:hypothetical protein QJS10_CPA05g01383 [Acorus calamus]|uniref:Uncharacterized protein n=1 Tax=Acorus calamus TaxID=4465 RepID=A0AAV9EXE6_ACOCL|nr:hypothetical protein QJS10_CPA05g01383 [Acorus calamus]
MLVHVVHDGHIFKMYANDISDFIHRKASTLGPESQMLKITVKLEDLIMLFCDETFFLNNYMTTNLENVECHSPEGMSEVCVICLEKMMDFEKDEMAIKCTPCGHVFHGNSVNGNPIPRSPLPLETVLKHGRPKARRVYQPRSAFPLTTVLKRGRPKARRVKIRENKFTFFQVDITGPNGS